MIENIEGVNDLDMILQLKELDAILIGPYDLSALKSQENLKINNLKIH